MVWTTPRTWVTGEIVTSALMNTHVRDNLLETAPAKATTAGDMLYATGPNTLATLPISGAAGKVLAANAGETAIEYIDALESLIQAQGDVIYGLSANTPARLPRGTARQGLSMNSSATRPQWTDSPQSLMTARGDIIQASGANNPARLPLGTVGQKLVVNSGGTALEYVDGGVGGHAVTTASGAHTMSGQDIRAVTATTGTEGHVERASSAEAELGSNTTRYVSPRDMARAAQQSEWVYKATGGSGNAYTFSASPDAATLQAGHKFHFRASFANSGSCTLRVDSQSSKTIKKHHDINLVAGDIESGQCVTVMYDGTVFQMLSQLGNAPGGAPADAKYLVGTARGDLSAEIAVGTAPGGQLGGSWASPTVDSSHSGSSHHSSSHTVASHSDTSGTGAELDELADGTETTLHSHAGGPVTVTEFLSGRLEELNSLNDEVWHARLTNRAFLINPATGTQPLGFAWAAPDNFASMTSVELVLVPFLTRTVQADFSIAPRAPGEFITSFTPSRDNQTLAVTANRIAEWDIGAIFAGLGAGLLGGSGYVSAGDYVAFGVVGDTSFSALGLKIVWVTT